MKSIHDDPAFAEASKTVARLKADRRERELQRSRLSERRSAELAESRLARRERQAEALIRGEQIESVEATGVLDKQIQEIHRELPIFDEAVRLAELELDKARGAATAQVHPAYRKALQSANRKLFDTLVAVGHAVLEVASVTREVETATDENPQWWRSPIMPWGFFGRPDIEGSRLMRALAIAVEAGYVTEKDVPPQWLEAWENWRFFRGRGQNGPLTDIADPVMSDAPRPVKWVPVVRPSRIDADVPDGATRIRLTRLIASGAGMFDAGTVIDLAQAQAVDLVAAEAAVFVDRKTYKGPTPQHVADIREAPKEPKAA